MPAATTSSNRGKKRGRPTNSAAKKDAKTTSQSAQPSKKAKITTVSHRSHGKAKGLVLTLGEGDVGQLGLGPDTMQRKKPAVVPDLPENIIQIAAGGMHTAVLTEGGEVFTFGCNDDGALGRTTPDEDDAMTSGAVTSELVFVQISAGDSHTAGLTVEGKVYIWGTFRDANGVIGLQPGVKSTTEPLAILTDQTVKKICSGSDHLACLTTDGEVYTLGNAEQGQLGRIAECFSYRGGRKGVDLLLAPGVVHCKRRRTRFQDIWTGSYVTFAQADDGGAIWAWGLNNYFQLGLPDMENRFVPELVKAFDPTLAWKELSGGQHHTLALDQKGRVYSFGRREYGRLGQGENCPEIKTPTPVQGLQKHTVVSVACGSSVSLAVTDKGTIFSWGMGSSLQLGAGDEEEDLWEPAVVTGKQLDTRLGICADAGGQHSVLLVKNKTNNNNNKTVMNGHIPNGH